MIKIKRFFYKNGQITKFQINQIKTIPELEKVFNMDSDVKNRIKEDMKINGFSKAKPIHVFWWKEQWVLCDGHTRFIAAKELNLSSIWVQIHEFNSINEAVLYSMKEQFNRRNCQDSELLKTYELLRQQEIDGHKLTAAEMSERLQKSKRHIFKLQKVFSKSTKEQLNAIRNGDASINQIYNEIKKQENLEAEKQVEETSKVEKEETENAAANLTEEPTESVIEQNIQKTIQSEIHKKQLELQNKELELKQKEALVSSQLSDKQILLIGAKCALILQARGKTNAEILSGSCFSDSVKASEIKFKEEDIALLQAI